ncbi:uroporphyrinogen-III synthase [Chlamydiifrater volucris]|uniref:uroporphyrinogen-III synthase n=1 Tax=Chlamydiifrater volucris TaxID=2681470 RepID=UPI001BCE2FC5|nr:uroporphyrinogen-III synthase [Chlamydiifrater volucris]
MPKTSHFSRQKPRKLYLGQNRHTASSLNAAFFPILSVKKMALSSPKTRRLFKSIPYSTHVLITSPSAAKLFAKTAISLGYQYFIKKLQYLSIGQTTSKVLRTYISQSISIKESEHPIAESLASLLPTLSPNSLVLYPSSFLARKILLNTMATHSIPHKHCFLYSMLPNKLPKHYLDFYQEFLFTSPSGVRAYVSQHPFIEKKRYSCIGEITARELQKYHENFSLFK